MSKIVYIAVVALILFTDSAGAESRGMVSISKTPKWRALKYFNVMNYGARGDGQTDDTQAFQAAWAAACRSPYHALLEVPARSRFLLNPITFSGPCRSPISMQIAGSIVARSEPWDSNTNPFWILFIHVARLTLKGRGNIDGRGSYWWKQSCKMNADNPCVQAPSAMTIINGTNISIRNMRFINSQQFHLALVQCTGVKVSGLTIRSPNDSPNTDGIHLFQSNNVRIRNCNIGTGDDCISIGNDCSSIVVHNIQCGPGHGISIGSLGKHGEKASVENIRVNGVAFHGTENGVRIKTWQGGSGYARNIKFQNISFADVMNPIVIDQYCCDSFGTCPNKTSAVQIENIEYSNIKGTAGGNGNYVNFSCSKSSACKEILLSEVAIRPSINSKIGTSAAPATSCLNAFGSTWGAVVPASCLTRA